MKKGIKTFCTNNGSTSTLNQQNSNNNNNNNSYTSQGDFTSKVSLISSPSSKQNSPTLEDLILKLELEEDMARKAKLSEYSGIRGRMSCVNNSDILRSARNALNQYPRFSLDGRDAMYRSSFGNIEGRRSVCSETSFGGEINDFDNNNNSNNKGMCCLPQTLAGESVVWRKPGVVAKLMGLEAMPVPISRKRCDNKERLIRKQSILRRKLERQDLERRLLAMEMQQGYHHHHNIRRHSRNNNNNNNNGCSSKNGYCVMNPIALEALAGGPGSWQPPRYT